MVSALILVVDLNAKLGIAVGVGYVVPVLIGFWFAKRSHVIAVTLISLCLIIVGYHYSASGGCV